MNRSEERQVRTYFVYSVLLKGAISVAEVAAGILAYFVALPVLGGGAFITLYLIVRGGIKALLIAAMLRNTLWAYPWSMAVIGAFIVYQLYEIAAEFSIAIVALTLFDFVVMYFIWREYQILKSHQATP